MWLLLPSQELVLCILERGGALICNISGAFFYISDVYDLNITGSIGPFLSHLSSLEQEGL